MLGIWISGEAMAQPGVGQTVKPYILFVVDVSGSMDGNVSGPPDSCSGGTERIDHARCALQQIVNAYGDATIALGKFRQTSSDSNCLDGCNMSTSCMGNNGESPDELELLVPLVDNNQLDILQWVDFTCGTCTSDPTLDPELYPSGITPIAGSLNGAQRYYQGLEPDWMGLPGGDPIRDDPLKNVFTDGAQCRPYLVILLTDGNEYCGGDTMAAASGLLATSVTGEPNPFRIETKPIGFGMSPCDPDIEAIAHAGGALDDGDPTTCEGYYAANESELAVAISQIIADSLKSEICNEMDDDCDVLIDEDFPEKGNVCNNGLPGACYATGNLLCSANGTGLECVIPNPGPMPGDLVETCNDIDDDCDGRLDEAPADCTGCADNEICDGMDNDCDMLVDENLVRGCGTDVGECTAGSESCMGGVWQGCTATGPFTEICDGVDNDCDGVVDGFAQECTDMPDPPGNPGVGICQPGLQVCPSDGSGMFGMCIGEVQPQPNDFCDSLDNDCDGATDEGHIPLGCFDMCGMGITTCVNGVIECQGFVQPEPETCDSMDNDCDGVVDEGVPDMGPCDDGGILVCEPGTLTCVGGSYMCVGGLPATPEACDCIDNDCDNVTDEDPGTICGPGRECIDCECASPCSAGEFPCPLGQLCENGFCVTDPCVGIDCPPTPEGAQQQCVDGACVRSCDVIECPPNLVCRDSDGTCQLDDCFAFPERCAADEACIDGVCVLDPCLGVDCPAEGEYCFNGACVLACSEVDCPSGERCVLGQCEPDPCDGECQPGEVCNETSRQCRPNPCTQTECPSGNYCDRQTGQCQPDACVAIDCPSEDLECYEGTCDVPLPPVDNRPPPELVTPAGGVGCDASGGGSPLTVAWLLLGLFLATRWRARSRREEVA